ncbi:MAG: LacI family DNA-binding transcriptional regulator, partial [Octadecabacter sp.]|nr:LacI family DNA-binding transcriptional regulator [Octadecabacter sp.]
MGKVAGRQRVTMQDIARAAGCSQPTVSFVLNENDSAKISEATKTRVFEVARELGYEFSLKPTSKLTKSGPSSLYIDGPIAFVVDNLATSPEGVHAFDGVMQAVRQTENVVMLAETRNDPVHEEKILRQFLDQGVAAIIFACVFTRHVTLPDIL